MPEMTKMKMMLDRSLQDPAFRTFLMREAQIVDDGAFDHWVGAQYISEPDEGEILLNGPIVNEGTRAFFAEFGLPSVSPESFAKELKAAGRQPLMRVDSPGGSIPSASGIKQRMSEAQAKNVTITAQVDGMAASAASVLTIAADMSSIAELGSMYIHRPMGFQGDAWYSDQYREEADILDGYGDQLAAIYDRRNIDYKMLGFDDAYGLMKGKTGNGTWVLAPLANESNLIGGMKIDPPSEERSDTIDKEEKELRLRMRMHQWHSQRSSSYDPTGRARD